MKNGDKVILENFIGICRYHTELFDRLNFKNKIENPANWSSLAGAQGTEFTIFGYEYSCGHSGDIPQIYYAIENEKGIQLIVTPVAIKKIENMQLSATKEQIIEASKTSKEAKKALAILFPSVFVDNTLKFKLGSVLGRYKYPKNRYALIHMNGNIVVLNVTGSQFWQNGLKRQTLLDFESITVSEFEMLVGTERLNDFYLIH